MISTSTSVELSKEEVLGLVFLLHSILEQTPEFADPSIDHPRYKTKASVRPLLLRLMCSAVNAEFIPPALCVRPSL